MAYQVVSVDSKRSRLFASSSRALQTDVNAILIAECLLCNARQKLTYIRQSYRKNKSGTLL